MQEWDEEIYMSGVRECRRMGERIEEYGRYIGSSGRRNGLSRSTMLNEE